MSTKLTGYVWDGCAASGMKLSSVAIMARLADFSNDEGVCWPSIETIARQIGAGMSTVRTAIARLEAEGWLTRKARRQGNRNASNVYQLNVAKLQAAAIRSGAVTCSARRSCGKNGMSFPCAYRRPSARTPKNAKTRTSKPVTTTWTTARSRQDSGGDHESFE